MSLNSIRKGSKKIYFSVKNHFSDHLLQWYSLHSRDLPWRRSTDPYKIWLSEVMLQQTRVDTVIPYYHKFLESFPTLRHLAQADQQAVLKCWEGLGYYSRGRNFHQAAKTIITQNEGKIPSDYQSFIALKGVGPYTAAAVLSIAYGKKYAVVDGNVIRVITRYLGIEDDIRTAQVKNLVQDFVDEKIPTDRPGDFNQSLMELGAIVCKPNSPTCGTCPLSPHCVAFNSARTDVIPYKSKAKKVPHYHIGVGLIVNQKNELLIALRPNDGMLGGLWEFPGGKNELSESLKQTVSRELNEELGVDVKVYEKFKMIKHAYSHFKITLHAYWCTIERGDPQPNSSQDLKWVTLSEIDNFPFPKANKVLINDLLSLNNNDLNRFLR